MNLLSYLNEDKKQFSRELCMKKNIILPKELVNIILKYSGKIKYRNGIFFRALLSRKYAKATILFCIL